MLGEVLENVAVSVGIERRLEREAVGRRVARSETTRSGSLLKQLFAPGMSNAGCRLCPYPVLGCCRDTGTGFR